MKATKRCAASSEGLIIIRQQLKKNTEWGWDVSKNDEPLIVASRLLSPEALWPLYTEGPNSLYADTINPSSWKRFLRGQPINVRAFRAFCQTLGLDWQDVVDMDAINPELLVLLIDHYDFQKLDLASDQSSFIRDVTIPDGSVIQAGETFIKTWEIKNSGNVVWKNRYLRRVGPTHGNTLICSPRRTRIPETLPGQNVMVSVELNAPSDAW